MNKAADTYRRKLTTPERALQGLPRRATAVLGFFSAQPPGLVQALADAIAAGEFDELRLVYMHATEATAAALMKLELCDVLKLRPCYMGPAERALVLQAQPSGRKVVDYVAASFSAVPRIIRALPQVDVLPLQVSAMDRAGYFSLGLSGAYSLAALECAKRIVVEVNPNLPRTFGAGLLHVDAVSAIVEGHSAIPVLGEAPAGPVDEQIAGLITAMIPDRACVQFGIGAVPNMVAGKLSDHKDLGVHTELLADGLAGLIECGAVSNRCKQINRGKNVFNVAMGSQRMYELMHDNPSMECWPADYVNDPRVIGQNDNVVSVNAMIEVDLAGQVNAEFLLGHQFSAVGGQLDFVQGAGYSKGGKSIIAAHATAAGGKVSRIVPRLQGPATDPRIETQYVVTEYGVCELRGKSSSERALGLIGIAHPSFRDDLLAEARRLHLVG